MTTIFFNMRTSQGVETVDEFTPENGQSNKDFRKYINDMQREYSIAGMNVYKSSRCTDEWKQN